MTATSPRARGGHRRRGAALPFTLLVLVVVLLAGAGLVRALDVGLLQAGNLAFRRDLAHQAERGIAQAVALINTGALSTETARNADSLANNYLAARLSTNAQGIPTVLVDDTAWTAAGLTGADITDSDTGVTVRWVIDRQCAATGSVLATDCVTTTTTGDTAADDRYRKVNTETLPMFRISVRATGPRHTQAFFQATVAR